MKFHGRVGSSSDMREIQLQRVPQDHVDGHVLRHEVRAVALARDLGQRDALLGALLLEPQAVHVDVLDLCDPLLVEDALGGSRIELERDAEVSSPCRCRGP